MNYRSSLLLSAACTLLGASASAQQAAVFHVSGAAAAGDPAGDLFLDSIDYGGGLTTTASELVFTTRVTGFNFNGPRKKIRMVSGAHTNGTSGLRRLEAEDGDASDVTLLDQELFNASIQDGLGHANLNNLFDQREHNNDWCFVIEFERELVDDDGSHCDADHGDQHSHDSDHDDDDDHGSYGDHDDDDHGDDGDHDDDDHGDDGDHDDDDHGDDGDHDDDDHGDDGDHDDDDHGDDGDHDDDDHGDDGDHDDDDHGDDDHDEHCQDGRGELLVFERNCDGELFIQPVDEDGNLLGYGRIVRTSEYVALTPGTNVDKYDRYGVVTGNEPLGAVALDLSRDFGVTSARRFIVCSTNDDKRDSDFKIIGVDSLGADCDGNGVNDSVDIANGALDADQNGVLDLCESGFWVYCTGDGQASTTVDCPCGNNVPAGVVEGCVNSSGFGASLNATGSASIAAADLTLHVAGLPSSPPGVFFAGDMATAGGSGVPFLSGIRCVGGSVVRLAKLPNTPGGQASMPMQGFPPLHQMIGAQPGQTTYFQFWYRDPGGPCGSSANMSNGLRVVWGL